MTFSQSSIWRKDFPALSSNMNGRPFVYLDSASSAQKPQIVLNAIATALSENYANVHRGLYKFSQVKTEQFEDVRRKVAEFINAPTKDGVVFTRNATEAINVVSQSWARNYLKSGDEIILSEMEHHANIVPWQLLRDQIGIIIKVIPLNSHALLDLDELRNQLSPRTKLIGIVHVSNATGVRNNISKIKEIVSPLYPDIKYLVDGTQSVVHEPIDIKDMDPDFFVFTGHKLYGPTGVGVLYARPELLSIMPPYQGGGDMIETVSFEHTVYKSGPARFEAGTPAIAEVIALGAALDYLSSIGMKAINAHEQELLGYANDLLKSVPGLTLFGDVPDKAAILSFTMNGIHGSDVAMVLDKMGIAVRTGHHCCMPLMKFLGVQGTIRASIGMYSNREDIDALYNGLLKVNELMV